MTHQPPPSLRYRKLYRRAFGVDASAIRQKVYAILYWYGQWKLAYSKGTAGSTHRPGAQSTRTEPEIRAHPSSDLSYRKRSCGHADFQPDRFGQRVGTRIELHQSSSRPPYRRRRWAAESSAPTPEAKCRLRILRDALPARHIRRHTRGIAVDPIICL